VKLPVISPVQPGQYEYELRDEAQALARGWFTDKEANTTLADLLTPLLAANPFLTMRASLR
jgi:hypothetical protein